MTQHSKTLIYNGIICIAFGAALIALVVFTTYRSRLALSNFSFEQYYARGGSLDERISDVRRILTVMCSASNGISNIDSILVEKAGAERTIRNVSDATSKVKHVYRYPTQFMIDNGSHIPSSLIVVTTVDGVVTSCSADIFGYSPTDHTIFTRDTNQQRD
jgi:hypothetical protein